MEGQRLRVFEKRVLRTIFDPKMKELAGDRRSLYNEELHKLYAPPNIIRVMKSRRIRWAEHVSCTGKIRNAYNILVGKYKGKRPLGRPRHRYEDNTRMDHREIR
jgi:hypothetical protein